MIAGVPIARDSAIVEAGFDLDVRPNIRLGFAYSGQLADHAQDHAVKRELPLAVLIEKSIESAPSCGRAATDTRYRSCYPKLG